MYKKGNLSRIKLSFDEKNIKTSIVKTENTNEDGDLVVRTETIVELPCYFRNTRLNGQLKNFGFEMLKFKKTLYLCHKIQA